MKLSIALFQPDIAGNTGAIVRLAACFAFDLHIIEPAGFVLCDKKLRRAAMDYLELVNIKRHENWDAFHLYCQNMQHRLIVFTTKTTHSYYNFHYKDGDMLLFGRESAGVPPYVHEAASQQLAIPMAGKARSLNLAISVAMAISVAQYPR